MYIFVNRAHKRTFWRSVVRILNSLICFSLVFSPFSYAQNIPLLNLPQPGSIVAASPQFVPVLLKGLTININNPFQFDFIVDSGNAKADKEQVKQEAEHLVKYFLASLTIPKDDLWVNLSPYEQDRVIPQELAKTELGRDMLAQDYLLKQLTASFIHPDKDLGKKFWDRVYQQAKEKYGTTDIPINTFNKVWILPERAKIFEKGNAAYVVDAHLKVMMDEDYQALQNNSANKEKGTAQLAETDVKKLSNLSSVVMREIVLPEIEKEVNEGQNFSQIRQIYHSLILAKWYKETVKESLLSKVYFDKNKTAGVDVDDKTIKDKIYEQYVTAYKKGVFNLVKDDFDPASQEVTPRKYFSGGINRLMNVELSRTSDPAEIKAAVGSDFRLSVISTPKKDGANYSMMGPQKEILDMVAAQFQYGGMDKKKLGDVDLRYLAEMWRQHLAQGEVSGKRPLKIVLDRGEPEADQNFILASMLTETEREQNLGAFSYQKIVSDGDNAIAARNAAVILNSLDGGIGESVNRVEFLRSRALAQGQLADKIVLAAKGTDLGYDVSVKGQKVFVSIAEAKILQLLEIAKQNPYGQMSFQPLVNWQSKGSYEKLLDSIYLPDRLDSTIPQENKRTYRQALADAKVQILPMIEQADLPAIEDATKNVSLKPQAPAQPGGHGQWGFLFLFNAYQNAAPQDGRSHIRVFYNGDNINSHVNESIVGAMVRKNWPIVKLTTAAMPIDKKGGKDGVRVVAVDGQTVYVPDQMEKADAQAVGQFEEFKKAGQAGGRGEAGKQPFNTNIFYINESLLHDILTELAAIIGEENLTQIISPTLIKKTAKEGKDGQKYVPIDGAIGTAMHNLNAFFKTSSDPRIKNILSSRGLEQVLYFIDVPRTEFFTPVKSAFDMYLQTLSDYYSFNTDRWVLDDARKDLIPPDVNFVVLDAQGRVIEDKEDAYWKEVQNLVTNFGNLKLRDLKSLEISGKVAMKDAELSGDIIIHNQGSVLFDLNSDSMRANHPELFVNGRLTLKDVIIKANSTGAVEVKPFREPSANLSSMAGFENIARIREQARKFSFVTPDLSIVSGLRQEVVRLAELNGVTQQRLEAVRTARMQTNGAFNDGVILDTIDSIRDGRMVRDQSARNRQAKGEKVTFHVAQGEELDRALLAKIEEEVGEASDIIGDDKGNELLAIQLANIMEVLNVIERRASGGTAGTADEGNRSSMGPVVEELLKPVQELRRLRALEHQPLWDEKAESVFALSVVRTGETPASIYTLAKQIKMGVSYQGKGLTDKAATYLAMAAAQSKKSAVAIGAAFRQFGSVFTQERISINPEALAIYTLAAAQPGQNNEDILSIRQDFEMRLAVQRDVSPLNEEAVAILTLTLIITNSTVERTTDLILNIKKFMNEIEMMATDEAGAFFTMAAALSGEKNLNKFMSQALGMDTAFMKNNEELSDEALAIYAAASTKVKPAENRSMMGEQKASKSPGAVIGLIDAWQKGNKLAEIFTSYDVAKLLGGTSSKDLSAAEESLKKMIGQGIEQISPNTYRRTPGGAASSTANASMMGDYVPMVLAASQAPNSGVLDSVIEFAQNHPGAATLIAAAVVGAGVVGAYQAWSRYTIAGKLYRLKSDNYFLKKEDVEALEKLGMTKEQLANILLKALENSSSDIRRKAVDSLGELGDTRAVEPLIARLGDPAANVRSSVADALGKLGDKQAIKPLLRISGDINSSNISYSVIEALNQLLDKISVEFSNDELISLLDLFKGKEDYESYNKVSDILNSRGDANGRNLYVSHESVEEGVVGWMPGSYQDPIFGDIVVIHWKLEERNGNDSPQSGSPNLSSMNTSTPDNLGGIDLNQIDLQREGEKINIQFKPELMQNILINGLDGLSPVIINIVPVTNIMPLLGLEPEPRKELKLSSVQ